MTPEFMDEKNTPTQPSLGVRAPWGQNSKGEPTASNVMIAGLRGQQSSQDEELTKEEMELLVQYAKTRYSTTEGDEPEAK